MSPVRKRYSGNRSVTTVPTRGVDSLILNAPSPISPTDTTGTPALEYSAAFRVVPNGPVLIEPRLSATSSPRVTSRHSLTAPSPAARGRPAPAAPTPRTEQTAPPSGADRKSVV